MEMLARSAPTEPDFRIATTPAASIWRHELIRVATRRATEFLDITERIEALVATSGTSTGLVNIQAMHTTTAIVVNEHEPLLLRDFESTLDKAAPAEALYRHDDVNARTVNLTADERVNGHAHCRALLLGPSVCLNVVDGRLLLGRWQRVFLGEFDGPQERWISALVLGCPGAGARRPRRRDRSSRRSMRENRR